MLGRNPAPVMPPPSPPGMAVQDPARSAAWAVSGALNLLAIAVAELHDAEHEGELRTCDREACRLAWQDSAR